MCLFLGLSGYVCFFVCLLLSPFFPLSVCLSACLCYSSLSFLCLSIFFSLLSPISFLCLSVWFPLLLSPFIPLSICQFDSLLLPRFPSSLYRFVSLLRRPLLPPSTYSCLSVSPFLSFCLENRKKIRLHRAIAISGFKPRILKDFQCFFARIPPVTSFH